MIRRGLYTAGMRTKPRRTPKERPPDPNSAESAWRLFIAIPTPPDAQELIAKTIEELESAGAPVRWATAGSTHLTLHFLGETDPSRAELLRLSFPTFAGSQPTFELTTSGLGCFPASGPPKVIWLGLAGDTHELTALQRAAGAKLKQFAIQPEERAFRPHITLGRVREQADAAQLNSLRARILAPSINSRVAAGSVAIPVRQMQLVRSYLERSGARHEVIATANLRPAD